MHLVDDEPQGRAERGEGSFSPPQATELPEDLILWDETLRDGEQTPGVHMDMEEKVEIAKLLDEAGVDVVCCGIPVVSPRELESVRAVAEEGLTQASVVAAARTVEGDIDAVLQTGADGVSLFIACSEVHLRHKLRKSRDEVMALAMDAVTYAKDHGLSVTFVTEDTARADLDFAARLYQACIELGADRILLCDTVGVLTPVSTRWLFDQMRARGTAEDPPEWGFHNHDDFGLATANALAAFEAGVPCLSVTVNGLGERAGNAALEEVVVALETLYGYDTGISLDRLHELSRKVEEIAGVPVNPLKPVVGAHAFTRRADTLEAFLSEDAAPDGALDPSVLGRHWKQVYGGTMDAVTLGQVLARAGIEVSPAGSRKILEQLRHRSLRNGRGSTPLIHAVRAWVRNHAGVSDGEFWAIVEAVTGQAR